MTVRKYIPTDLLCEHALTFGAANKKGTPFTFTLGKGQVIKGWDIGMQGIAVGGERRITIPPHLAYGSKANAEIPANSTLVFDVKCLSLS